MQYFQAFDHADTIGQQQGSAPEKILQKFILAQYADFFGIHCQNKTGGGAAFDRLCHIIKSFAHIYGIDRTAQNFVSGYF
jgi:hypothetical protein